MNWNFQDRELDLSQRGLIMGILNVTPDSFSDGGQFLDTEAAVAHACELIEEGADIIDIGGESTRPGADEVPEDVEIARTLPVIRGILERYPEALLSIDTSKSAVALVACEAGVQIINDVTGLTGDPEMIEAVQQTGAGVVIMHMRGKPRTMQQNPEYDDVVGEVRDFLQQQLERAEAAGIRREQVVLDPGIGFGKTLEHNLELLRRLPALETLGCPLLLGVSRKSFIGKVLGTDDLESRFWPTVALTSHARERGVRIFRVHDVQANREALRMTEAILHGVA